MATKATKKVESRVAGMLFVGTTDLIRLLGMGWKEARPQMVKWKNHKSFAEQMEEKKAYHEMKDRERQLKEETEAERKAKTLKIVERRKRRVKNYPFTTTTLFNTKQEEIDRQKKLKEKMNQRRLDRLRRRERKNKPQ